MAALLPSWQNTTTRQIIIDFVSAVTTVGATTYAPAAERIATFDNDGTLWCERPQENDRFLTSCSVTMMLNTNMPTMPAPSRYNKSPENAIGRRSA